MALKKKKPLKQESIVKSLKGFVKDEDGFVSKDTILKVGLSTVVGMAALGVATDAAAADHTSHQNSLDSTIAAPGAPECLQHTNTVTHASY
jgi:hypothetical protein